MSCWSMDNGLFAIVSDVVEKHLVAVEIESFAPSSIFLTRRLKEAVSSSKNLHWKEKIDLVKMN